MIFPFCVRQLNLCNKRFSILCSVFVLLASSWKEEEKGTPSIYIYIYIYPNCRLSCSEYFSCYYLGRMLENMLFYRTLIPWDAGIIWSHDFSPFLDLLKPPNQRTNYDKPGNKKKKKEKPHTKLSQLWKSELLKSKTESLTDNTHELMIPRRKKDSY